MNTLDIQTALDDQLKTIVDLPALQTENTRLDASKNLTAFTRATLLPSQSTVISLGVTAEKQMLGLYQVDVFYPSDIGTKAARTLSDAIVNTFPIGLTLTSGTTTVTVEIASVMAAYTINKYYCIPVRVQWSVYRS
jgi:hypothetical protein